MDSSKTESPLLTADDLKELKARGVSPDRAASQLKALTDGFPFVELAAPCVPGKGIEAVNAAEASALSALYERERLAGRVTVFVPASGAASRMFKSLLSVYGRDAKTPEKKPSELRADKSDDRAVAEFAAHAAEFAFWGELAASCRKAGKDPERLRKEAYVPLLERLLTSQGLDYANQPKGLILFHDYGSFQRSAFEEHLVEASQYAAGAKGNVRLHFTVSPEHEDRIREHVQKVLPRCQAGGARLEVGFSNQKPSTDTLAVDLENRPVREADGRLHFRPAGHGALLENLQDLKGDIVFIKNIDNVVPDRRRQPVLDAQRLLGGYLVKMQQRIFELLCALNVSEVPSAVLKDAAAFAESLGFVVPQSGAEQKAFLIRALDRPVRVCGMVKNVGEPGGGPFWVKNRDGALSKQIVEKSQADLKNEKQRKLLEGATHFNPVNLVCGVRNWRGESFDLARYVDADTGFIAQKSKDGRDLKALEMPGLWNGAMAHWITFFVEIPLETFAPVKEVNDLLKPEHRQKV
ncbi:MAG TPA: DUF4301 family protein [Verrucomicrobiae bacterium]|jgi:hypothetical protein|nr:DUF4301 family protein [Verrucomicrobiae bacterium]